MTPGERGKRVSVSGVAIEAPRPFPSAAQVTRKDATLSQAGQTIHTRVAQLLQNGSGVKVVGLLLLVGLDAAHKVRSARLDAAHERLKDRGTAIARWSWGEWRQD